MSTDIAVRRTVAEVLDHVWENRSTVESRNAYAMMLLALARENPNLACLTADMNFEDHFAVELPRQHVDLGIAEQNMMGVAAGMTVSARPVFANGMSPFAIARAYEQIKIDVAGANLPVKIVGTHAGLASGHYGPTHHSLEDIGMTRMLPNMTVVVPADAWETAQATVAIAEDPGRHTCGWGARSRPRCTRSAPRSCSAGRGSCGVPAVCCSSPPVRIPTWSRPRRRVSSPHRA